MNPVRLLVLIAVGVALPAAERPDYALIIHGGAGRIVKEELPPEMAAEYRQRLLAALQRGRKLLENGGGSVHAVTTCITAMEDDHYFNAGIGAVLNAEGAVELDASIMAGDGRRAGAVAASRRIKNPILAALRVMEESPHVLLVAGGADAFADAQGLEMVENEHLIKPWQREQLRQALERGAQAGDGAALPWASLGTVGCVALDRKGQLAAGTSTGGLVGKAPGRVGDSPLIGAGTYAWDGVCAVSATGHGESFIRVAAAHHIAVAMKHRGLNGSDAADEALAEVAGLGGNGGVIVLGADGSIATRFNTEGMFRAWVTAGGQAEVRLFGDDEE